MAQGQRAAKADAERNTARQPPQQEILPAASLPHALAVPGQQAPTAMEALLNDIAPVSFIGRPAGFNGKDSAHRTRDDGADMDEGPRLSLSANRQRAHPLQWSGNPAADRVGGYIYDPSFQDTPRAARR